MLESFKNNTFEYKKLTEAEQQTRGILGRLVGVIADTKNPTRNGRQYEAPLWEHVFEDPVMQEKIENRCCFGELGHPVDREEIDPEKIAICLAEVPKIGDDGKLYGVFDILNTPNGKILKALCDYGTNIGVSSRGSGDILADNTVDPETYYCECWDAVVVPAVKSARPKYVCESLNSNSTKLRKALTESLNSASDEDRKVMKETLNNLNINLNEEDLLPGGTPINIDDIPMEEPWDDTINENTIMEAASDDIEDAVEVEDEIEDEVENEVEKSDVYTVGELIKEFKDFEEDMPVEFKPIEIDGEEYEISSLNFDNESEDGKLIISVGCDSEKSDNIDDENPEESAVEEEPIEGEEIDSEEVADSEADEVIESLKEVVRQNGLLENEVKSLKTEKTVSDAEVKKLKEDLKQYKESFARISELAAEAKNAKKEVSTLKEDLSKKDSELSEKDKEIVNLKTKLASTSKLTESADANANKVKVLVEKLNTRNAELDQAKKALTEQAESSNKEIERRTAIAKKYKNSYNAVLKRYVESKASMLGVRVSEITNRLNENYSIDDIDKVCDTLLTENAGMSRLSFGIDKNSRLTISEQLSNRKQNAKTNNTNPEYGYEIDQSLLDLAGLSNKKF